MSHNADSFTALTRHETFYISTADLSFLLGHVQFRVHRYFFERESAFFRGKLTTPVSPGAPRQGSNDTNPIVLEDVKPLDFEKFLWVFYNPRYSLYEADVDDWSAILRLAHQWGFSEVKSLAVRELEKKEVSDIDRIVIYQTNDVDRNLLIPRYAALCERERPLTLPEGLKLGMETTLVIASAREYVRANKTAEGARSPTSPNVQGEELNNVVRELFGIPPTAENVTKDDPQPSSSSGGLLQKLKLTTQQQQQQQTQRKPQTSVQPTKPTAPQQQQTASKKGTAQKGKTGQTKTETPTPTTTQNQLLPTIAQILQTPIRETKAGTKAAGIKTNEASETKGEVKKEGAKREGEGEGAGKKVDVGGDKKTEEADAKITTTNDDLTTITNGDSTPATAGSENVTSTKAETPATPLEVKGGGDDQPKESAPIVALSFPPFDNAPLIDLSNTTSQDGANSTIPSMGGERDWTAADVSG